MVKMYLRKDFSGWEDDANNPAMQLRYFIHPQRFACFAKMRIGVA